MAPAVRPAKDAPNVVLVLFDDVGFGSFGCYGAEIDTPTIDALAGLGIRYNNFHVTPLCSPTRASLLTGRNQTSTMAGMKQTHSRTMMAGQLHHHGTRTDPAPGWEYAGSNGGVSLIA